MWDKGQCLTHPVLLGCHPPLLKAVFKFHVVLALETLLNLEEPQVMLQRLFLCFHRPHCLQQSGKSTGISLRY